MSEEPVRLVPFAVMRGPAVEQERWEVSGALCVSVRGSCVCLCVSVRACVCELPNHSLVLF